MYGIRKTVWENGKVKSKEIIATAESPSDLTLPEDTENETYAYVEREFVTWSPVTPWVVQYRNKGKPCRAFCDSEKEAQRVAELLRFQGATHLRVRRKQ